MVHKSQIRKLPHLRKVRKSRQKFKLANMRICNLRTQLFLAGLKLLQISKYIIFLRTNICPKCFHSIIRSTYIVFRCLKYTCVAKKQYQRQTSWIRNTAIILANLRICDLRTESPRINHYKCCGPAHSRNVWICVSGVSPKFADL